MTKCALVTGITGQDGSYLAEFLLAKGYVVHGVVRRSSSINTDRIDHLYSDPHEPGTRLFLHYADITDPQTLRHVLDLVEPDEIYNLAGQSNVRASFDVPAHTSDAVAMGVLHLLEAIRQTGREVRFYQASSSEMYGAALEIPQRETTPFNPQSPYGCAKLFGHTITVAYRTSYDLFACSGILFNHESPRRGVTFVTRKITRGVAAILAGTQTKLYLGNLDARRDWGYAPEYVEAMWLMLQQAAPDDYVIATGETHSVREFVSEAFALAGLDWEEYVAIDPRYYRPAEVDLLIGDAVKARTRLGWMPRTTFHDLVRLMLAADFESVGIGLPAEPPAVKPAPRRAATA
jgi:GDPmannose 4,6-dehydratase